MSASWNESLLPELLPIYYKKLFPFTLFCKWLRYGESSVGYFRNREFSFTLKDDIYLRYRSYSDQPEMEKDVRQKCPYKIDIGPVYSCSPKMRDTVRAGDFTPQYKELVFDIDMTDYDEVRVCCSGADICGRCWPLMIVAIKILHRALTEDFGFCHILWVYSGRRGVHCWVADEKARKLSGAARTAVAEYLSVVKGGANMRKKVTLKYDKIHPSIAKALEIINPMFEEYAIKKQDFLGTDERLCAVKELITSQKVMEYLADLEKGTDAAQGTSSSRWANIKAALIMDKQGGNMKQEDITCEDYHNNLKEIMLQYAYPRLDINVSKGVNHLLKSPFCIHPKTGRVCVPIDITNVDSFDPFKVPLLSELTEQLVNADKESGNLLAYKLTSLRPYVETFERFVNSVMAGSNGSTDTPTSTAGVKRHLDIETAA